MAASFANTQVSGKAATRQVAQGRVAPFRATGVRKAVGAQIASPQFAGVSVPQRVFAVSGARSVSRAVQTVFAVKDGAVLDGRKLRVAVIGGGPSGACAAETLAKGGVEAFLIERKLDNCKVRPDAACARPFLPDPSLNLCVNLHQSIMYALKYVIVDKDLIVRVWVGHKWLAAATRPKKLSLPRLPSLQPCGGAIPLCMVEEFDLPMEIIDRKVTKMKMISPSNREVDVGKTLSETEWIGMCRREVFDDYLRKRAEKVGANILNGLFMRSEQQGQDGPITIHYTSYADGGKMGTPATLEVGGRTRKGGKEIIPRMHDGGAGRDAHSDRASAAARGLGPDSGA
jgi:hypothetical protein